MILLELVPVASGACGGVRSDGEAVRGGLGVAATSSPFHLPAIQFRSLISPSCGDDSYLDSVSIDTVLGKLSARPVRSLAPSSVAAALETGSVSSEMADMDRPAYAEIAIAPIGKPDPSPPAQCGSWEAGSEPALVVLERVEERDPSEGVGARKSGLRMLRGENGAGVESVSSSSSSSRGALRAVA